MLSKSQYKLLLYIKEFSGCIIRLVVVGIQPGYNELKIYSKK